jgi:hypothetical protein
MVPNNLLEIISTSICLLLWCIYQHDTIRVSAEFALIRFAFFIPSFSLLLIWGNEMHLLQVVLYPIEHSVANLSKFFTNTQYPYRTYYERRMRIMASTEALIAYISCS